MKKIFFILAFTSLIYAQQMNPDGYVGGFSLHITPIAQVGSGTFSSEEINRDIDYPFSYGFNFRAVMPLNPSLSFSLLYQNSAFNMNSLEANKMIGKLDGRLHQMSATFSFYFK